MQHARCSECTIGISSYPRLKIITYGLINTSARAVLLYLPQSESLVSALRVALRNAAITGQVVPVPHDAEDGGTIGLTHDSR